MSKLLYISLFILLVLLLQVGYSYHFFYIEQFQLFMFSEDYLFETVFHPGGLSIYLGEFFVQFFYYPLVGEIITAFLLVCAAGLVKKYGSFNNTCFLPEGLILLFLLIDILDFNFLYAGIVAYLFCVIFLLAYQRIRKDIVRILTGCLMSCLLYLIAGSVFVVFAVSLLMLEINVYRIKKSMLLMPLVFMILLVFYLDHAGYLYYSEIICFADGIYALKGGAGWVIYAPWFLLAFSPFLSSYSDFIFSMIKNKYGKIGIQMVLLFLCGVFLLSLHLLLWPAMMDKRGKRKWKPSKRPSVMNLSAVSIPNAVGPAARGAAWSGTTRRKTRSFLVSVPEKTATRSFCHRRNQGAAVR